MDDKRQQRTGEAATEARASQTPRTGFWEMLEKLTPKPTRPDPDGEEVVQTVGNPRVQPAVGEPRSSAAKDRQRALTARLMEQVCEAENLNRAYARVKANKGAPGIDGMSVKQLGAWVGLHKHELIDSLLDGSYQPKPVRGAQIPKPGGKGPKGMRQLGIPTVVDRLVQQAIRQVLEPILDPAFSASSYGFRPGRGAHDALARAKKYTGKMIVQELFAGAACAMQDQHGIAHLAGGVLLWRAQRVVMQLDFRKLFARLELKILYHKHSILRRRIAGGEGGGRNKQNEQFQNGKANFHHGSLETEKIKSLRVQDESAGYAFHLASTAHSHFVINFLWSSSNPDC